MHHFKSSRCFSASHPSPKVVLQTGMSHLEIRHSRPESGRWLGSGSSQEFHSSAEYSQADELVVLPRRLESDWGS